MSAENLTADTYLTERLAQYQNWYDKKAVTCKTKYLRMRAFTVISTEQLLGHEQFLFQAKVGPYKGTEDHEAFLLLVERVEDAIATENSATLNAMTLAVEAAAQGVRSSSDAKVPEGTPDAQ